MFHFPADEMTLSLENVVMLGGLPCVGQDLGPIDIPRRGTMTSLLGSRTFLGTIARRRCTCPSPSTAFTAARHG
jgi:hypothetical protein